MSATDFAAGDLIISKEVDPSTLQVGDIITYQSTNEENFGDTVTHKIRELTTDAEGNSGFITYGTTTDTNDKNIVTYSFVIGKYQTKLSGMGKFVQFMRRIFFIGSASNSHSNGALINLEKPDNSAGATSEELSSLDVVGFWRTAARKNEETIEDSCYRFRSDGTFETGEHKYNNKSHISPEYADNWPDGWFVAPMGYGSLSGTYTFDGEQLILNYTEAVAGGHSEPYEKSETLTVQFTSSEEEILLNETRYVLDNDESYSIEELCSLLGVDASIEAIGDVVGSWRTAVRERQDYIGTYVYTFNTDGTFEYAPFGCIIASSLPDQTEDKWIGEPKGGIFYKGTYVFDGEKLILNYIKWTTGGGGYSEPYEKSETLTVQFTSSKEEILLNGTKYVLDNDKSYSIEELCSLLGVDASIS